jgi:predicted nucleic acid-binding protein
LSVVVDASIILVLLSGDARRPVAERLMRRWLDEGEELHAPALMPYEIASGLTRLAHAAALSPHDVPLLWAQVELLPITYHVFESGAAVTDLALRLRRQSAYDAAYLALAESLGAELWAFDGPLAVNAASIGYTVNVPA